MEFRLQSALSSPEKEEWDRFVGDCRQGHFFQRSDWGRFQEAESKRQVRFLIGTKDGGVVLAALILQRRPFFIDQSIYEIPCGPVFSDLAAFDAFLDHIDQCLSPSAISIEMSPRWLIADAGPLDERFTAHDYRAIPDPTHRRYHDQTLVVNLNRPVEEILKSFRDTTRHEITKAQKAGVTVRFFNDSDGMNQFYQLYKSHAQARQMAGQNARYFDLLMQDVLTHPANGFVAMAMLGDLPLSGGIFFISGRRAWYTYGASSPSAKKHVATSHWLHWGVMQKVKAMGGEEYDLGGILNDLKKDSSIYGVMLFKKGFSDAFVKFSPSYRKTCSPLFSKLIEWKRRLRSR